LNVDCFGLSFTGTETKGHWSGRSQPEQWRWLYRTKHGVFGPFSLAHLRSQEALFRRVRRFQELRIWRTGASEAADIVLLSAAFGDAAEA